MKHDVVAVAENEFGTYRVVDMVYTDRPSRILYGPQSTPQSGLALDDDPELLFDYNQRFMEILHSTQPSRVLVIGGGALTLPMALHEQFPAAIIDVVEINPLLPQLAADYFGYRPSERLHVFIEDGVTFMERCRQKYDAIVIDAFTGRSVVTRLLSDDMVARYYECLQPHGVVLTNIISRYYTRQQTLAHHVVAAFGGMFDDIELYPADYAEPKRHEQNLIVVARNAHQSYDYLQSVPVTLMAPGR